MTEESWEYEITLRNNSIRFLSKKERRLHDDMIHDVEKDLNLWMLWVTIATANVCFPCLILFYKVSCVCICMSDS